MKPIAIAVVCALALGGTACSQAVSSTAEETTLETADAGGEVQGTLNLNIGRNSESTSGLIVGSDAASSDDGLIIAPESSSDRFEDVPALEINIADPLAPPVEGEDDVVRIEPEN